MLNDLRGYWVDSTLINITHDPEEALDFPRVLVFSRGRIVEDGRPGKLISDPESRFASLVKSKHTFTDSVRDPNMWHQTELKHGRILRE